MNGSRLAVLLTSVLGGCGSENTLDYLPNEIPTISVSSPLPGQVYLESQSVPITVSVVDPDESDLTVMSLRWIMVPAPGAEGPTNTDSSGQATFDLPPLSPGVHTMTITVYDPRGANATAVATITVDQDADGDGFSPDVDCDDDVATTHPGAQEICNGVDDDCVDGIDDGVPQTVWYADDDGDGYGTDVLPVSTCEDLSLHGYVEDATDCNDSVATTHPGAVEDCNGVDDDCLNGIDDGLDFNVWYYDLDHDGYGNPTSGISTCDDLSANRILDGTDCSDLSSILNHDDADGDGIDSCDGDCNDNNGEIFPGATEVCNDLDDDCFGGTDEIFVKQDWWIDNDLDGYGNPLTLVASCVDHSATHIHDGSDCNDSDAGLNHDDLDSDGRDTCSGDCEDLNPAVFPGQFEACNGIDDNCKGGVDENVVFTNWFVDADGDGAGDANQFVKDCVDLSATHSRNHDDCNDLDASLNTLDEDFDGVDTCKGDCDDFDATVTFESNWNVDVDGDGYGGGDFVAFQCHSPDPGSVSDNLGLDCDETNDLINPGAREICGDGIDDDCSKGDLQCGPIGSFRVQDGKDWMTNPPVYSCIEACALLFGGVDTDYHCSADAVVLDYKAFVTGFADQTFCFNPTAEDFVKEQAAKPGYNCMAFGCSYSAYTKDNCTQGQTNWCWLR